MGCCSLKSERVRVSVASLVLVVAPLEILGHLLMAALWLPSKLSMAVLNSRASLQCLLIRNREVVNRQFRSTGWRCAVCGRLLRHWPRISGLVYRTMYPALLCSAWLAGAAVLAGSLIGAVGVAWAG
jgi:hypothetical protein